MSGTEENRCNFGTPFWLLLLLISKASFIIIITHGTVTHSCFAKLTRPKSNGNIGPGLQNQPSVKSISSCTPCYLNAPIKVKLQVI